MADEYACILQDVRQALARFSELREGEENAGGNADETTLAELRKILDGAERDVRVLVREAKSVHVPELIEQRRRECEALQREVQERRQQLVEDANARAAKLAKDAKDAKDAENPDSAGNLVSPLTTEQRLGAAVVVQKDTNLRVDDAVHAMQETHALNEAILETLDRDLERLNRVSDDLDGLAADTRLARRQLGNVLRSLAQNKCMLGIVLVVAIIILIVSIVQLVKAKGG